MELTLERILKWENIKANKIKVSEMGKYFEQEERYGYIILGIGKIRQEVEYACRCI